jgi:simple sugar transport system substrate-binding protein
VASAPGVIDALEEAGLTVDYNEIDAATNADPVAGTATFTGYVSANPDVKLVVTDHGALTATAETFLKAANKQPGEIHIAGFDLSPATVAAVKGGWTELVIDQQPWLQGYLPILQLCLTKTYGFSGLHIDTGAGLPARKALTSWRWPRKKSAKQECIARWGRQPIGVFAPTHLGFPSTWR